MDSEKLLSAITEASAQRTVSEHDVLQAFRKGVGEITQPVRATLSIVNILYAIGGAIVFIGIILFFRQQWAVLSSTAKILITLGSGIVAYVAGVLIARNTSFAGVASAFFLIFALITPLGIFVTFNTLQYAPAVASYSDIIYGVMFAWTAISLFVYKKNIFRIFSVLFGSFLYFSTTHTLLAGSLLNTADMLKYRFLLLSVSLILIGYTWKETARTLSAWMYAAGSIMFLGAALALGGYAPAANQLWEAAFVGLAFGMMFLSIVLKSRAMLVISSIYLMAYILKITAEYFSDTIGWPLALIGAGFTLIAIGYGTFAINQKYIARKG